MSLIIPKQSTTTLEDCLLACLIDSKDKKSKTFLTISFGSFLATLRRFDRTSSLPCSSPRQIKRDSSAPRSQNVQSTSVKALSLHPLFPTTIYQYRMPNLHLPRRLAFPRNPSFMFLLCSLAACLFAVIMTRPVASFQQLVVRRSRGRLYNSNMANGNGGAQQEPAPSTFREAEVLGLKLMQEGDYDLALKGKSVCARDRWMDVSEREREGVYGECFGLRQCFF